MAGVEEAVLDASVMTRWLTNEPGAADAERVLEGIAVWRAPRVLIVEVAEAIRRKHVDGEIAVDVAEGLVAKLAQVSRAGILRLGSDETLAGPAFLLALRHRHRLADCLYVAQAAEMLIPLVTADDKQARIARAEGLRVQLLGTP